MIKNFLAFVGACTLLVWGHKGYTKYMEDKIAKEMGEAQVRAEKIRKAREAASATAAPGTDAEASA